VSLATPKVKFNTIEKLIMKKHVVDKNSRISLISYNPKYKPTTPENKNECPYCKHGRKKIDARDIQNLIEQH